MRKRLSIKEVVELLGCENEELLFGQFLDDFFHVKSGEEMYLLIRDEPNFEQNNKLFLCILAGTVEVLAKKNNLLMPAWVYKKIYYMDEIYYAFNTENKNFQIYLQQTTPIEYKERNLLIGDSILERC